MLAVGVPIYVLWLTLIFRYLGHDFLLLIFSRLTSTVWRAAVAEQWMMFLGAAIFMVSLSIYSRSNLVWSNTEELNSKLN